jgi:hypothetical protein
VITNKDCYSFIADLRSPNLRHREKDTSVTIMMMIFYLFLQKQQIVCCFLQKQQISVSQCWRTVEEERGYYVFYAYAKKSQNAVGGIRGESQYQTQCIAALGTRVLSVLSYPSLYYR